jgi:hypothetical protein
VISVARLEEHARAVVTVAITCMSRLCTAQKRSAHPLEGDVKPTGTI